MNNILKANQPQPHEQWNGNLANRKTIQAQKQRIEELEKEIDFEILHRTIAQEELHRMAAEFDIVTKKLKHKEELFRMSQAHVGRIDRKLLDAVNRLLDAQDEFFNLGDKIMGLAPDPDRPFKKPLEVGK